MMQEHGRRPARKGARWISAILLLVVALLAAAPAGASPRPASAEVTRWVERMLSTIEADRVNPPQAARRLAVLSVSVHRALERCAARRGNGLSRRAAITGAARHVLGTFSEPPSPPQILQEGRRARSLRLGARVAVGTLERHATDRLDARVSLPGDFPQGPDPRYLWEPTAPDFQQDPLEPAAGTWRTWRIGEAADYVPPPPPSADPDDPSHPTFLAELEEVFEHARRLTPRQERIAEAWAGGGGTVTPPGMWNRIAIRALEGSLPLFPETSAGPIRSTRSEDLSARETARLFAALNTAQADAFIVAWLTKYTYWSPRPITYIRELIEPGWETYVATPPFPSYVSGHSTVSGAAARVLARLLPRHAVRLRALGAEATVSRMYGGIHYVSDNEVGYAVGREVARPALVWHRRG